MPAITWIPQNTIPELLAQLHTKELMSSALAVDQILHMPDRAVPELVKLWKPYKPSLARYGLNVIREIESSTILSGPLQGLRRLLLDNLAGAPEFIRPHWWTEELCANHRGFLKYLDIRRSLLKRIKFSTSDPNGWCETYGLPPVHHMTGELVERAHKYLDAEKAKATRLFYTHFSEEPCHVLQFPDG